MNVGNQVESKGYFVVFALAVMLYFACFCTGSETIHEDATNHFKMLSTVEYSGKGQFRSQAETLISVKTIEAGRRHIMEKVDVNNIADLIKYAIRQGLTTI